MEFAKNSTPKRLKCNVRESIGLIKPNTVTNLVHEFSKKNALTPILAENESPFDVNPIVGQTKFFNELSAIHQSPECGGDDSGFTSMTASRRRSNTVGTSATNRPTIIEKYLQFPNFKWSQLKYFGISNPKEYMMLSFDVDLDTVGELSLYTTANLDSKGGDSSNDKFVTMRKRSQSFATVSVPNAKKCKIEKNNYDASTGNDWPINPIKDDDSRNVIRKRCVADDKRCGPDAKKRKIVNQFEFQSVPELNPVAQNVIGSSDDPKTSPTRKLSDNERQTGSVMDLIIRIQKSIQSFDRNREIRKQSPF